MKILVLNFNLKGVGTYRRSFYFSRELARHHHDVTMVTVSQKSKFTPRIYYKQEWMHEVPEPLSRGQWVRIIEGPGLGYKWLPGWGSGPIDIGVRIREILFGEYDVVYGFEHHPNVSWPVYLTRYLRRYTFYSDWCDWFSGASNWFRGWKLAHKVDGFFEEQIRRVAHRITTNSSLLKQRAIQMGIPDNRVIFVPEGADTDYIKPEDRMLSRKDLGLPLDVPFVGMVIDKYWRESLDLFCRVRSQVPSAKLLVIGARQQGLVEYAKQIGIDQSIVETGWVSDKDYSLYLAAADVLFLIMKSDLRDLGRWPGKVSDYLAAGRATVITDVGDAAMFIKQHDAGLVACNSEEMAGNITYLLENYEVRCYYDNQARMAAVKYLDWRKLGHLINRVVTD